MKKRAQQITKPHYIPLHPTIMSSSKPKARVHHYSMDTDRANETEDAEAVAVAEAVVLDRINGGCITPAGTLIELCRCALLLGEGLVTLSLLFILELLLLWSIPASSAWIIILCAL